VAHGACFSNSNTFTFVIKRLFCAITFVLFAAVAAQAQNLAFIGLKDIKFGMTVENLGPKKLMIDTSTSYKDSATFVRNTRCITWQKSGQDFALTGFTASKVEYEFCDGRLFYVFITVSGAAEVSKALATLQINFPKAGCGKNVPIGNCKSFDTTNGKMRMIATLENNGQELSLVLIPKKLKY
jgi:hypothetical protein